MYCFDYHKINTLITLDSLKYKCQETMIIEMHILTRFIFIKTY